MFDYAGAHADGYSDDEILNHLKGKYNDFNFDAALKDNYSVAEIADHLNKRQPKLTPPKTPDNDFTTTVDAPKPPTAARWTSPTTAPEAVPETKGGAPASVLPNVPDIHEPHGATRDKSSQVPEMAPPVKAAGTTTIPGVGEPIPDLTKKPQPPEPGGLSRATYLSEKPHSMGERLQVGARSFVEGILGEVGTGPMLWEPHGHGEMYDKESRELQDSRYPATHAIGEVGGFLATLPLTGLKVARFAVEGSGLARALIEASPRAGKFASEVLTQAVAYTAYHFQRNANTYASGDKAAIKEKNTELGKNLLTIPLFLGAGKIVAGKFTRAVRAITGSVMSLIFTNKEDRFSLPSLVNAGIMGAQGYVAGTGPEGTGETSGEHEPAPVKIPKTPEREDFVDDASFNAALEKHETDYGELKRAQEDKERNALFGVSKIPPSTYDIRSRTPEQKAETAENLKSAGLDENHPLITSEQPAYSEILKQPDRVHAAIVEARMDKAPSHAAAVEELHNYLNEKDKELRPSQEEPAQETAITPKIAEPTDKLLPAGQAEQPPVGVTPAEKPVEAATAPAEAPKSPEGSLVAANKFSAAIRDPAASLEGFSDSEKRYITKTREMMQRRAEANKPKSADVGTKTAPSGHQDEAFRAKFQAAVKDPTVDISDFPKAAQESIKFHREDRANFERYVGKFMEKAKNNGVPDDLIEKLRDPQQSEEALEEMRQKYSTLPTPDERESIQGAVQESIKSMNEEAEYQRKEEASQKKQHYEEMGLSERPKFTREELIRAFPNAVSKKTGKTRLQPEYERFVDNNAPSADRQRGDLASALRVGDEEHELDKMGSEDYIPWRISQYQQYNELMKRTGAEKGASKAPGKPSIFEATPSTPE